MHIPQRFVYAGKEIPPYGTPGQVLVKTASAFYYTAWDDLDHALNESNAEIDEGEYYQNVKELIATILVQAHGFHS